MPTKRDTEIFVAAMAGFEEQKKRLNARIAELRQMLSPGATEGSARVGKTQDVFCGPCQNCCRPTGEVGRSQKANWSGFIHRACPKETETERGWTKGDHRGHEAALGGIPEVTGALIPGIRSARQARFLKAEFR